MPLEMALDLAVLGLYDIFIYAGGFDTDWGALHDFQPPNGVCTCLPCAVMHMGPVLSSTVGWSTTCLTSRPDRSCHAALHTPWQAVCLAIAIRSGREHKQSIFAPSKQNSCSAGAPRDLLRRLCIAGCTVYRPCQGVWLHQPLH